MHWELLLMMAVFAVMRWSSWDGQRPHSYQGYRPPSACWHLPRDGPDQGMSPATLAD